MCSPGISKVQLTTCGELVHPPQHLPTTSKPTKITDGFYIPPFSVSTKRFLVLVGAENRSIYICSMYLDVPCRHTRVRDYNVKSIVVYICVGVEMQVANSMTKQTENPWMRLVRLLALSTRAVFPIVQCLLICCTLLALWCTTSELYVGMGLFSIRCFDKYFIKYYFVCIIYQHLELK